MNGATARAAAGPGGSVRGSASPLSRKILAAYAAPAFAQALIHGPAGAIIQGIYGKYFGVPLASLALVLLIGRIFDAVTDPLIGYLSDRVRTRWGHRKPWIVCGSLIAVVACWFLYAPSGEVTTGYFLFWFLLAYLGWTISEIPYRAWMAEISRDYDERTRIAAWRTVAMYLGFMAFYGIPFLPMFETTEFTPQTLRLTAILAAVALPLTALIAVSIVPAGAGARVRERQRLKDAWPALLRNRPFLMLLGTFAIGATGSGMAFGALFFFVDGHLGLGAALAFLFLLGSPIGAASMPLWSWVARRIGKQRTWAVANVLSGTLMLLHLLIPVGPQGQPWLIAAFVGVFVVSSVGVIVPLAMLADIVDYGRLRFRGDYAGSYFSVQTLAEKGVAGLGGAIGLAVAGWFGFNPQLQEQTAQGTLGLLLAFPILPAVLTYLTVPLIWRFPIDERRQKIIVRRLGQREARAAGAAAST